MLNLLFLAAGFLFLVSGLALVWIMKDDETDLRSKPLVALALLLVAGFCFVVI